MPFLLLDAQFTRRTRPLVIAGPEANRNAPDTGDGSAVREFIQNEATLRPVGYCLKPEETRAFGAVNVTPFPVVHRRIRRSVSAYRVEAEGRVIAYSADTEWTETLIPLARDADLFIAEAYYYDKVVKNHLSLKTLEAHLPGIKAEAADSRRHMSDDMLARLDTLDHAAASDGMIVRRCQLQAGQSSAVIVARVGADDFRQRVAAGAQRASRPDRS